MAAIATTVAVIVAIVGLMAEWRRSRKSQELTRIGLDQDREIAEATASRAEAAAALSEEYTRRVVDALERIAADGVTGAAAAAVVRWSLVHHGGDTYRLTNEGQLPANDVTIKSHPTLWIDPRGRVGDLGPGEAVAFMAAPDFGTEDMTITVTWQDATLDATQTWRYPLPPRPPR